LTRSWGVLAVGALMLAVPGCSRGTRTASDDVLVTPEGRRIITQRAIERSGARTAWDALRRTVTFYWFDDGRSGQPRRVDHRGQSSILLQDQPIILVDGVQLNDFSVLGGIPAEDLFEIEVLSGIDATTYYGTNATKGVIRIWTKVGAS
jgi:outer membrane cobalamin receptor